MNERIRELAGQALDQAVPETWSTLTCEQLGRFQEKFAELIIQECIDCVRGAVLADDVALRNNLGFNDGIAEGVVHIQKHFGVEE